eukprot:CAMPEP_0197433460 /NCGR_PEP_ID=MMETSP1175-20131217/1355_1 /TAXON_ID=1003142 /ORGANISM="Triceratium dubium, Strain CCMP147" /LENGTH=250 /DNA_ID=CAMNT_0042961861 /DNA_START=49 /DNA_END=801 /DNA_ORIENTATION=+
MKIERPIVATLSTPGSSFPKWVNYVTVAAAAVSVFMDSVKPFVIREFVLKYSIQLNKYQLRTDVPRQCPSPSQIAELAPAVEHLDLDRYSGLWYSFATNDPTQPPSGFCSCDRFLWSREKSDGAFISELNIFCNPFGAAYMKLEGVMNVTGYPGMMREGAPESGASLIPGYVLWVDDDYSATIRYFCAHDYLGVDVFSSMQIWTRAPVEADSHRGIELVKKAHELLHFDNAYLQFTDHGNCDGLKANAKR